MISSKTTNASCEIPERPEFIFWHPPYWDILYPDVMYQAADVENKYGFDPRLADLSRIKDWDRFVATIKKRRYRFQNLMERKSEICRIMEIKSVGLKIQNLSE